MNVCRVTAFIFSFPFSSSFYRTNKIFQFKPNSFTYGSNRRCVSRTTMTTSSLFLQQEQKQEQNQEQKEQSYSFPNEGIPPAVLLRGKNDPLPRQQLGTVRCVIISDTHGRHNDLISPLPYGDVLIHLGDIANKGSLDDIKSFKYYLQKQLHPEKIILQGNHDRDLNNPNRINLQSEYSNVAYVIMKDEMITVANNRLRLYGVSWDTCECDNFEFIYQELLLLQQKQQQQQQQQQHKHKHKQGKRDVVVFDKMNDDSAIDFFLTHRNPYVKGGGHGWHGSKKITNIIHDHDIPLHLFGHVHWGRGINQPFKNKNSIMVNCSSSWNQPVVVDWDPTRKRVTLVHCPCPQIMQHENGKLYVC